MQTKLKGLGYILILIFCIQSNTLLAQETVNFSMQDERDNIEVINHRAERAVKLLKEKAFLNETQEERLKANFISLDNLLLFKLRGKNMKVEHLLLEQLIEIKAQRLEMLQRMLTEYQYQEYNKWQQHIEKVEYEKRKLADQMEDPMYPMRTQAIGWDLLQDDIHFK